MTLTLANTQHKKPMTHTNTTTATEFLKTAAVRKLRRAEKALALANKQRDILAKMASTAQDVTTADLEVVSRAFVRAIRAAVAVRKARDHFLSFIKA
ncbi:MAG TPA: hypothetical protein VLA31_04285 [Burkholderiaceae bacterium]|nr:hypothetical protein [Burkholderiaceae bacterium]